MKAEAQRRYRVREEGGDPDNENHLDITPGNINPTRGPVYEELEREGLFEVLAAEKISQGRAAEIIGCDQSAVSKSLTAWLQDRANKAAREDWTSPKAPPFTLENLDELVEHFKHFRRTYFSWYDAGGHPHPFETPWHQERWVREIIRAIILGTQLCILSPPRHGKTETLVHLDIWYIAAINKNAQILQIGGNKEVAENSSGLVREHLEDNEPLIETYTPPGQEFRPPGRGSGKSWTNTKMEIAFRDPGIKSATMTCVGWQSKILSRDARIIIADDIEGDESTLTEQSRQKTRNRWGITVMSRKEPHTAIVVIGSRQHPDDIYNYLKQDEAWTVIVETAHDDAACEVEPGDSESIWNCGCSQKAKEELNHEDSCHVHDHTPQEEGGCVLWPERQPFHDLMKRKNSTTEGKNFSMVWQNEPADSTIVTFPKELVEGAETDEYTTGAIPEHYRNGDPIPIRLVAGLDPSGSGYQATFLWGLDVETNRRFAIDFTNDLGGGIKRAREQIRAWYQKYGVRYWVIETNLYHGGIMEDEILRAWCNREGVTLRPHHTGADKWDDELGVSSLATWMDNFVHRPDLYPEDAKLLALPAKTFQDKEKWKDYKQQLVNFSKDARGRSSRSSFKSDLVMASWFPEKVMQRWRREHQAAKKKTDRKKESYPFRMARASWGHLYQPQEPLTPERGHGN